MSGACQYRIVLIISLQTFAMNIFIILLLALDLRMAHGFNQPEKSQAVEVVVVGSDKCPKNIQPVCATNGQQFLYFQNKCHMEVKNYEFLTQGLLGELVNTSSNKLENLKNVLKIPKYWNFKIL